MNKQVKEEEKQEEEKEKKPLNFVSLYLIVVLQSLYKLRKKAYFSHCL